MTSSHSDLSYLHQVVIVYSGTIHMIDLKNVSDLQTTKIDIHVHEMA